MRRGFTLVELLVVISVLGLLIAILLPSLSRAREQGKRASCASNRRQVGTLLNVYLNEYNDRLPHASLLPSIEPTPIYISDVLQPKSAPVDANSGGVSTVEGDIHAQSAFRCPSDKPSTERPPPNTNKSYFQSERSSYEYRVMFGGDTIMEAAARVGEFTNRTVAAESLWILRDYYNFHGKAGTNGSRRYVYVDGHVADFEN